MRCGKEVMFVEGRKSWIWGRGSIVVENKEEEKEEEEKKKKCVTP